jgi:HNH endonuclease
MLALEKFVDCEPLSHVKGLDRYLWPSDRPDWPPDVRNIRKEFDYCCALCSTRVGPGIDLHHIVPWREALLLYDGNHAPPHNLVPLCGTCHKLADDEEYTRDYLRDCRLKRTACNSLLFNPSPPDDSAKFERFISRGKYSVIGSEVWKKAVREAETEVKAESLARAASARRRKALGESEKLLDEAENLKPKRDETRALIFYERGKIASLKSIQRGDFGAAAFLDSKNATSNEFLFKMATFAHRWALLRKEAGGTQAPEVSLETDCGIRQFENYRDSQLSSLLGKKWYVYQLSNIGEYYAEISPKESIKYLAEAGDWIDKLSMTELRPKLYQNLALAFRARGDWWRCVLAASASQGLFFDLKRQENKGQTLLTYLEMLKKLRLQALPQFLKAREEAVNLNRQMNNRWAFGQILKLIDARGCIPQPD